MVAHEQEHGAASAEDVNADQRAERKPEIDDRKRAGARRHAWPAPEAPASGTDAAIGEPAFTPGHRQRSAIDDRRRSPSTASTGDVRKRHDGDAPRASPPSVGSRGDRRAELRASAPRIRGTPARRPPSATHEQHRRVARTRRARRRRRRGRRRSDDASHAGIAARLTTLRRRRPAPRRCRRSGDRASGRRGCASSRWRQRKSGQSVSVT